MKRPWMRGSPIGLGPGWLIGHVWNANQPPTCCFCDCTPEEAGSANAKTRACPVLLEEKKADMAYAQEQSDLPLGIQSQHTLKSWPVFFEAVRRGAKRFEIRFGDRAFQVGDALILREWVPFEVETGRGRYTGRSLSTTITYILDTFEGLQPGWVVLGISKPEPR